MARTIRSIGIPAIFEPPGLFRGNGKRLEIIEAPGIENSRSLKNLWTKE